MAFFTLNFRVAPAPVHASLARKRPFLPAPIKNTPLLHPPRLPSYKKAAHQKPIRRNFQTSLGQHLPTSERRYQPGADLEVITNFMDADPGQGSFTPLPKQSFPVPDPIPDPLDISRNFISPRGQPQGADALNAAFRKYLAEKEFRRSGGQSGEEQNMGFNGLSLVKSLPRLQPQTEMLSKDMMVSQEGQEAGGRRQEAGDRR